MELNIEEPPVRVMALHALLYCPRLFYLEEVEEIRVADDRVYAGRELHQSIEDEDVEGAEPMELSSVTLGIFGKVDCVKRRDGVRIPYEHKRGRCRRGDNNEPTAWSSDAVQAVAYAMLLEEAIQQPVPEARIRYHHDQVTVRLNIDAQARQSVIEAVGQARRLRNAVDRPPVADNENLCRRCSLAPVCLPGDVADDADDGNTLRSLPTIDQRTSLHVLTSGSSIGRSGDQLVIRPREGPEVKRPAQEIAAVLVHGFSQVSSQALRLCVSRDIAVHWMTSGGRHMASLCSNVGQVQRRIRQYKALTDASVCLRLSQQLASAKIETQHRFLMRSTRQAPEKRSSITSNLRDIAEQIARVAHADAIESIRGHEGLAAVRYFASLNSVLNERVPEVLRYQGRSRRPTRDRFSALLNFGYALLHTATMRAVLACGLEPSFGFMHAPRSAAHPLVLDLLELFRVPLWDMAVIASLNRAQWDADADFTETRAATWLSDSGKKKAIALFEDRLQESWKHPVAGTSLSYSRIIELEVRLLEKEWTGEPGLFGRLRVR